METATLTVAKVTFNEELQSESLNLPTDFDSVSYRPEQSLPLRTEMYPGLVAHREPLDCVIVLPFGSHLRSSRCILILNVDHSASFRPYLSIRC
jgi:hypothetical protein